MIILKSDTKLVCNLYNKEKCILEIRTLKQAFNYGLVHFLKNDF